MKHKGILFVVIGAVCFSAKAIFIKLAYSQYNIDDVSLLALRFGISLPFFLAIGLWRIKKGQFKKLENKDIGFIAIMSFLGYYISSFLDFKGLMYIPAAIERIILFIYPTFVVIFSRVFLKKQISTNTIYALIITYLGIVIIAVEPRIFEVKDFYLGVSLILLCALTYSLYLVFGGEMINKYGSINFNTIAMVFSSVYVLVHFSVFSSSSLFNLPFGVYVYGVLLAVISTVIPTFLVMEGVKILGANLSSIVGSVGPASTVILGYFFLNETLSLQEVIGSVLVLVGVLLIGKGK